jgi:hypothetical protein
MIMMENLLNEIRQALYIAALVWAISCKIYEYFRLEFSGLQPCSLSETSSVCGSPSSVNGGLAAGNQGECGEEACQYGETPHGVEPVEFP